MSGLTAPLNMAHADRYGIEKHVCEGGMATLYLAHGLKHDRRVASGALRPALARTPGCSQ